METETKGNNDSSHNHMLLSVHAVVYNGAEKSSSLINWILETVKPYLKDAGWKWQQKAIAKLSNCHQLTENKLF